MDYKSNISRDPTAKPSDDFEHLKEQIGILDSGKVSKEDGKGLSTNDFTNADKDKLVGLPTNKELTETLVGKEDAKNKTDSLSLNSTYEQYPSAKATVDFVTTKLLAYYKNDEVDKKISDIREKIEQVHTHENKDVLDEITADKVQQWDGAEANVQPDWNEQDTSSAAYINNKPDLSKKEDQENKVTSLSSASTNEQYPGAKAVYDFVNNKVSSFATKTVTWTETETETPEKGKMMIVGGLIPKIQVAAETGITIMGDGMQYAWLDLVTKDNFSGITMPSIHMTTDNPDWSGLIQYDGVLQKEITMKETLGGKSDKTNIIEGVSGSSLTLLHNTEYRIGNIPSTFEFVFLSSLEDDYISSVVFASGNTAPTITYEDGIHWSGDDLTDGVFVPAENKHYTIVFWYDGTYINGAVRGVEI